MSERYSEANDFKEHKQHIDTMYDVLDPICKISELVCLMWVGGKACMSVSLPSVIAVVIA